jgi:hypothetical protein
MEENKPHAAADRQLLAMADMADLRAIPFLQGHESSRAFAPYGMPERPFGSRLVVALRAAVTVPMIIERSNPSPLK